MPITLKRLEERIFHADYEGELTVAEITSGNLEALAQEQNEIPYVAIINATNLKKVPFDVKRLRSMDMKYSAHTVIVINPPMMLSILLDILRRLMSKRIFTVSSLDEALELAHTARETISA